MRLHMGACIQEAPKLVLKLETNGHSTAALLVQAHPAVSY